MTSPDLLRPSRDGDQFHYTWAARQALRLLDDASGLAAIYVEAVDPSEHLARAAASPGDDATEDGEQSQERDGADGATGDEVIDLAEYWGSSDIDEADRVVYRQFKHSTTHPDDTWTFSFLTKTLVGFARKYRSLLADHPAATSRVSFEFITNRPPAASALTVLDELREGKISTAATAARDKLARMLSGDQIVDFARRVEVDQRAPSLLRLRSLLETQVADLLPGVPADQALLLREMISSRATSIAGRHPAVRREDMLAALKTSEDQLAPAPNLIEMPLWSVGREQFNDIAEHIRSAEGKPVVIHGPGGVGKSVLSMALAHETPPGSVTLVYDCYGNGSYRRPSAARHQAKQGLVQLANELATRTLCDPLVPSATADDFDYARALRNRISKAATALATVTPEALLTLVIDAADSAAMIARDNGERSFVTGLVREELPTNVRLVVTCRTERRDLLALPAGSVDLPLRGFDLAETRSHLAVRFSAVADADAAEFHSRTSHNPRVQATVLDATTTLTEALDWLAPRPVSADTALDAIIERQVAEVRDRHHSSTAEMDQICIGLAALRPMIPARVLAELADVEESVVLSFVADLGRPLLVDSGNVQFRDEPTETWFRGHYRPSGEALDDFLARISPLADHDAYVAASLPALLFEAQRFDELVRLALSDEALPDNKLPPAERNELQRREIAEQRTHFALTAALRGDHDLAAAQLALRLGALTAGRTRRLSLIRDNTDLAARFLDAHLLEQLVASRSIAGEWPNSGLLYEGALLAGAAGQTDQARNRLRSAMTWVRAWTRQASRDKTPSKVTEQDILQIAWGLLNTDGPDACIDYLRAWTPRTLAFDVGVCVARRPDAGRNADLEALALRTRGKQTKFALAQVFAERNLRVHADVVMHLLRSTLHADKPFRPGRRRDEPWASPINEQAHLGLTAVTWLLTQALAYQTVSREEALRVLDLYLPSNMGHRTGEMHQRDLWQPLLGFAVRAWLEGRELTSMEIEGPDVTKAREREPIESSRTLRAYRANVEPLVSWANLWTALQLDPTSERQLDFTTKAKAFLGQQRNHVYRDDEMDQPQLNMTLIAIVGLLAQNPTMLAHNEVSEFCKRNRDSLWRSALILLTQRAAAYEPLRPMAAELARQVHSDLATAREDAHDKAKYLVQLARATYQASSHEAEVHFQAALDTANAIGDDAWTRWQALLTVAKLAGETSEEEPGRAYRLGQIAEGIESYVGDYLDYTQVVRVVASLSLPEALALASRWRDRRVAPVTRLAEAFCLEAEPLLQLAPTTALTLLPLCDRPPDLKAVAQALKTSPESAEPTVLALLHFLRSAPPTPSSVDQLLDNMGLSRRQITDTDPSLLPPYRASRDPEVAEEGTYVNKDAPRPTYDDLDLTTVDGWAGALARSPYSLDRRALFDHVVYGGPSPLVIQAFGQCPAVDEWDLSALLEALDAVTLSMGAQAALDTALATLLGRLAKGFLLVSFRSVDAELLQARTGRNNDYDHIASRALAEQVTFTADQSFALAGQLAKRLGRSDRLRLFDAAAQLFVETAPLDCCDGNHPAGMAGTYDLETAVAAVVWTGLGDPSPATRWRAAHAVHLMLVLNNSELADRLCDLATGKVDESPFRDQRLPFYERHATQWLLLALSRASLDDSAQAHVARFAPVLRLVLDGAPHAVNSPLARDTISRLCEAVDFRTLPVGQAARASVSMRVSTICGVSCCWPEMALIRWRHRVVRSSARVSGKLGVRLLGYQGRFGQRGAWPWVGMYQHQIAV